MSEIIQEAKPSLFKSFAPKGAYKGGKPRPKNTNGQKIYKLSSNENMLGASPLALQAIKDNIDKISEYPSPKGEDLPMALSEFYSNELTPGQFITGNSGVALIDLFVKAFLGEGLECITSSPTFSPYTRFSSKMGALVRDVPLEMPDFSLNVRGILDAVNDNTRIIWICSPNNPTGTYVPKHQVEEIIDQVPDHVVVVYDEVYHQYTDADDYSTGVQWVKAGKQVIALNSFSKAYGLAGMRVGYAYSTPAIAEYINKFKRPFYINTLSSAAAMAALQDDQFIQRTKEMNDEGRAYLSEALTEMNVDFWPSQSNFIFIRTDLDDKVLEKELFDHGVMVRPATKFGAKNCIRVTIGTDEANKTFINALKKIITP